jgi:hypothetical protein
MWSVPYFLRQLEKIKYQVLRRGIAPTNPRFDRGNPLCLPLTGILFSGSHAGTSLCKMTFVLQEQQVLNND